MTALRQWKSVMLIRPLNQIMCMKQFKLPFLLLIVMLAMTADAQIRENNPATRLANRMTSLQKRGYMAGHQDDPFYGLTWEWDWGRSDIRDLVGDYPAVMGFDLGGIEMSDEKNLDSVPFLRIREQLVAHVERGGIVTLSWHPRNPLTGGTAWDVDTPGVVTSILPGGSQHQKFQLWMQRVGDFIATLRYEASPTGGGLKGAVPIIFRPWHENNGSWFWWGQKHCTDQEFHNLWNMLQDYLRDEPAVELFAQPRRTMERTALPGALSRQRPRDAHRRGCLPMGHRR